LQALRGFGVVKPRLHQIEGKHRSKCPSHAGYEIADHDAGDRGQADQKQNLDGGLTAPPRRLPKWPLDGLGTRPHQAVQAIGQRRQDKQEINKHYREREAGDEIAAVRHLAFAASIAELLFGSRERLLFGLIVHGGAPWWRAVSTQYAAVHASCRRFGCWRSGMAAKSIVLVLLASLAGCASLHESPLLTNTQDSGANRS